MVKHETTTAEKSRIRLTDIQQTDRNRGGIHRTPTDYFTPAIYRTRQTLGSGVAFRRLPLTFTRPPSPAATAAADVGYWGSSASSDFTVGTVHGLKSPASSGSNGMHTLPVFGWTQNGACGSGIQHSHETLCAHGHA